jgi:CPA2 family monovalent cation:H+ antiporter-2
MHNEFGLLINLSISLGLALVLGLVTERLRLSPIVGYLLAGILLGPQTPGFVADVKTARELAEIGVVLLMFGVGLHFDLHHLLSVRKIAIPGAIGQILVASVLGTVATLLFGWPAGTGLVLGIAISVASTVVLVRMLMDNNVLRTSQGQIAVGWLIVEDIFTVFVLLILPGMSGMLGLHEGSRESPLVALALAIIKFAGLGLLIVVVGRRVIPWLLNQVARTRSRELFTLAIFALALAIATGSAALFGVSVALGAFLAGMVVGQTEVSHQAAADALPMRDAFAALFFVSVGMLFDPRAIVREPWLLLSLLSIVVIVKPLTALFITWVLRYSIRTAFTVAVALAQIGEFSFLLAHEAMGLGVIPEEGQSLLITCSLISISANPLLFRTIDPLEKWLHSKGRIWRVISQRSMDQGAELNMETKTRLAESVASNGDKPLAVVVGYGPVGQTACQILKDFQIRSVIIDLNLDTIRSLAAADQFAIYGDATRRDILEAAGIRQAKYLLVTIPEILTRTLVILTAKDLNARLRIFARARYLQERAWLEEVGATDICIEEAEMALGLAVLLLREVGADEDRVREEIQRIRRELARIGGG